MSDFGGENMVNVSDVCFQRRIIIYLKKFKIPSSISTERYLIAGCIALFIDVIYLNFSKFSMSV